MGILVTNCKKKDIRKEENIRSTLKHPPIKKIDGKGLLLAVDVGDEKTNHNIIKNCIANGVITDWFLFAPHKMRIAPPLIITDDELKSACNVINNVLMS